MGCRRMSYEIRFERKALKFINRQTPEQKRRLFASISKLPEEGDRKKLAGRDDVYRLRVEDFRVIYTVEREIVTVRVLDAGNRGDIYK